MAVKKRKLVDLNKEEKGRITRISAVAILSVAIVCAVLVGCFACKSDPVDIGVAQLTDEQKADYWKAQMMGVTWAPQTDETHNGILKGFFVPMDILTDLDSLTGKMMAYFMVTEDFVMDSAQIVLSSESGELRFESEDVWTVKFSEKNEVLYMTVTDSDGKTVYYQQK